LINLYFKALEALYEGSAQKGFGVFIIDGSPVPLGSTATGEPIEIPRSLWGEVEVPRCHRAKKPYGSGSKTTPNKLIPAIINSHREISGYS
jgi:hypothetical protein